MKACVYFVLPLLGLPLLQSCGRPPSPEPPPSDFPVASIVAKVDTMPIEERIPLVGNIRAKEQVRLLSEMDARVMDIFFNEGSQVEAGQKLIQLDTRKEEARMQEARARYELAKSELARGRELLAKETIPPQEYDRLLSAMLTAEANVALLEATLEDALVVAPFAGMIGERTVSAGQMVNRGEHLATIVQIDPLEIEFQVPERYMSNVLSDQLIRFQTVAFPGETFEGVVEFVAPAMDEASRTLPVKATVENPDGRLRPGMFGTVDLVFQTVDNALVVPETAVFRQGDQAMVVVVDGESIEERSARYQPVTTGIRSNQWVKITEGLERGEIVVAEGHQKIPPGARISFSEGPDEYGVEPDPPMGAEAADTDDAADQPGPPAAG